MKSGRGQQEQRKLPSFAEELIAMAKHVLSHEGPSPQEKETVRLWQDQLVSCVNKLMDIFAAHDALQMGEAWHEPFDPHAEMLLNAVLSAAYMISNHADENPIQARLVREAKKTSAAHATQARKEKSKRIDDVITSVGRHVWIRHPRQTDNRIAANISDEVNRKLKEQNLKVMKTDGIRKRLKRLRTNGRPSS